MIKIDEVRLEMKKKSQWFKYALIKMIGLQPEER